MSTLLVDVAGPPPRDMEERPAIRSRVEPLLFAAALVVLLAPIWTLRFFPTQDGPGHAAVAAIERRFDRPDGAFLHAYYVRAQGFSPNDLLFFLTVHALRGFSIPTAEKIVLSLYAVLLPVCVRYTVRAIAPANVYLSWLTLPFVYSVLLQIGLFNYCLSVAAFFGALGFWMRYRGARFGWGPAVTFAALACLVATSHAVSFVMVGAAVSTGLLFELMARSSGNAKPFVWRRVVFTLIAMAPGALLVTAFASGHASAHWVTIPLLSKLRRLVSLYPLIAMDPRTIILSIGVSALFAALALACGARRIRMAGRHAGDAVLAMVLVFVAIYLLAPDELAGGGFLVLRLIVYPFLMAIPWFAFFKAGRATRVVVPTIAAALTAGLLLMYYPRWLQLNQDIQEYVDAGDRLQPGRTLLSLQYRVNATGPGDTIAYNALPFLHLSGYLTSRRPLVDLSLYEASTDYFPLRYQPARDPYRFIGSRTDLEREPPRARFLDYHDRTGGAVDYVLLWKSDSARPDDPDVRSVRSQLDLGYREIYVSPRRLVRVYERLEQ